MKTPRLLLALALVAGTTTALAAPEQVTGSPDPASMAFRNDVLHAGVDFIVQNEAEKRRLEAQGFPQYND
jgi:hypothetical protein